MSLLKKLPKPMLPDETRRDIQARESYHVLKIISEFVEAGEELRAIQPAVSIYGSARTPESRLRIHIALGTQAVGCRIFRDFRRRAGHYGSGQQRRVCRRKSGGGAEYRVAARTKSQSVSGFVH